ncbi:MAG: hypothetical protein AAGD92_09310 [Pseudomonadota bacterium]
MRTLLIALFIALLTTGCNAPAPPATPPAYSQPPDVAASGFVTIVLEETINMSIPQLRAFLTERPLTDFLEATETISPPASAEILKGAWPTAGAVRRLQLEDGHYVIERILENRPDFFQYQIWVFTNSAGRGVEQIIGEQRFIPITETETKFQWSYNVKPKSAFTKIFVKRQKPELRAYLATASRSMAAAANASITDDE